jgi:propanol-preferring alcohol dehydrogenase
MEAAVVHGFGAQLRMDEVPIPEVGKNQILVRIRASGVCHTDLHAVI